MSQKPLHERSWLAQAWWAWSRVLVFNVILYVGLAGVITLIGVVVMLVQRGGY